MTEAELANLVVGEANRLQIKVLQIPDSRRLADRGRGFPDLLLVGARQILYVELKDESGRLSRDQQVWRYALQAAGARFLVWRPHHWRSGEVRAELQHIALDRRAAAAVV